jgi:hypothetical protein
MGCNLELRMHHPTARFTPFFGNEMERKKYMHSRVRTRFRSAAIATAAVITVIPLNAQQTSTATVPVSMTVTASVASDKRMPEISQQDIVVAQGKQHLKVTGWTAAQGDHAGLELFILIDDASDPSLGMHLGDLRTFINAQPSSTQIGVGYMQNATVQIAQNFTADHDAAAKALRLPMGRAGAYGSPYLSAIDLMKRWPASQNRREVIMVTDGIDRARRGTPWRGLYLNPDVDSASEVAMRTGTIIHTIYAPGRGRLYRNYWDATNGQMGIAKLSDVTGGESFFLGLQSPVTITPYLDQLQKILDNQYLVTFSARPQQKAQLQNVRIDTELAGVELAAADAVWVPVAK